MTREQRQHLDSMLRDRPQSGPYSIADQRLAYAAQWATKPVPSAIKTTEVDLGGLRSLLIESTEHSRPGTILFFHGGGFIVGSPETEFPLTANLVARTGMAAYSPDYRLAPEHPYPAAVDDALSAYRALLEISDDPASIVFAGDSAGGGLTITTLVRAKEEGLPMPAGVVAFSPVLDFTGTGASMDQNDGVDPIFSRALVEGLAALYLNGADHEQDILTPATRGDVTGFPPLLLQAGGNEVLLDDSTRMAKRAREAGVDVILDITANAPHVFQQFAGSLSEADEALDRAALFLTQNVQI
jgi:monoterpene epsilon-lactone hydrolase